MIHIKFWGRTREVQDTVDTGQGTSIRHGYKEGNQNQPWFLQQGSGILVEGGWKDGKCKKNRVCYEIETSEATPKKSRQHGCLTVGWIRTTPIDELTWTGPRQETSTLYRKRTGKQGMPRAEEIVFLWEESPNGYPIPKASPENTYIQITLYRPNRFHLGI